MMTNAWRTIIAEPHESFGIRDNQLLIQNEDSEKTIPLEQIRELLLTSNQGKISLPLITRLASQNTSVIFCDAKRSHNMGTVRTCKSFHFYLPPYQYNTKVA